MENAKIAQLDALTANSAQLAVFLWELNASQLAQLEPSQMPREFAPNAMFLALNALN